MKKNSIVFVVILFIFLLTACNGTKPVPTSTPDENEVATAVATMMSGLATETPLPEPTATLTPEPTTLLPRGLYYGAKDSNGQYQIFRLDRDGTAATQVTFEQDDVKGFDISPIDGEIIYVVQNSLISLDASGNNRQLLLQEPNANNLHRPTWSPDGKTIVYDTGRDVIAYSFDTRKSEVLLVGSDTENIYPVSFSPDGKKLIIRKHKIPSSPESMAFIFDFTSQSLISIAEESLPYPCYGFIIWDTTDSFFCNFYSLAGAVLPGLWRVSAIDGSVETLIGKEPGSYNPPFLLVAAPRQDEDGNLYYLYAESDNGDAYQGFSLMQSNSDGQTNRVQLRPEIFPVRIASWTPDGRGLIVFGQKEFDAPFDMLFVPVDSSLPIVELMSGISNDIFSMRWGQ